MYLHIYDKENLTNLVIERDKFLKNNSFLIYNEEYRKGAPFCLCLSDDKCDGEEQVFWLEFSNFKEAIDFINELIRYLCCPCGLYPPIRKGSLVIEKFENFV